MPVVDRREFGGRFDVVENARRLANYRFAEIQLMEMLGGWCHTTPEIPIKAAFGHYVWDDAQHADALGARLSDLRSTRSRVEAPNDAFVKFCEKLWGAATTLERLVGVFKVLKPHLVSTYTYHLESTDPLVDAPTRRLLTQIASLEQSHVLWGQSMLETFLAKPEVRQRAAQWQAELENDLIECGGVTGTGVEAHWLPYASPSLAGPVAERLLPHERRARRSTQSVTNRKPSYTFRKEIPPSDHIVVEPPFWFTDDPAAHRMGLRAKVEGSREWFAERLHALLYGEIDTVDRLGRMLAEFPELPWEMRMDLAKQAWDEARHIDIVAKAAQECGAEFGSAPWPTVYWRPTQNETDPLRRLAVNNCWSEAGLCDTLHNWMRTAAEAGNHKLAELFDYLLADEIGHVNLGVRWIRELTADDPERFAEIQAWAKEVIANEIAAFNTAVYGAEPLTPETVKLSL